MKCRIMQHFIWVFTVCQSTCLCVPGHQGVNSILNIEKNFSGKTIDKCMSSCMHIRYHVSAAMCLGAIIVYVSVNATIKYIVIFTFSKQAFNESL